MLVVTVVLVACASEPDAGGNERSLPPRGCDDLSAPTADGQCSRAGIATCLPGFLPEGGGCRPDIPESCGPGTMALPGERTCRPVSCEPIPRDGVIVFVRAGTTSGDGSEGAPFAKIGDALAKAPAGAVIAIDDGTYDEDLVIVRPAKLWGRCAASVTIRGASTATIEARADVELHGVAVRGAGTCVWISGAPNALLDRVWLHDCGARGIEAAGYGSTSRTRIVGSLIERVRASGIGGFGAEVTLDTSVIRDVSARAMVPETGDGILMRPEKTGAVLGSLEISRSIIERTRLSGVTLSGVPSTMSATVVRDIQPIATKTHGLGIYSGKDPPTGKAAATLALRDVIIERTHALGVEIDGGEATIERLTIRDVSPELLTGAFGYGLQLSRGRMRVDAIAVERAHGASICVHASSATIAHAWISATLPEADERFGDGIVVTGDEGDPTALTELSLFESRVQHSARAGLSVFGSTATVTRTALACNRFDLHVDARIGFTAGGEPIDGAFKLKDGGGNVCGCGAALECTSRSEQLDPMRAR